MAATFEFLSLETRLCNLLHTSEQVISSLNSKGKKT